MNADDFFGLQVLLHREREPRVERQRVDTRETMSDQEFKRHFRFRKNLVIIKLRLLRIFAVLLKLIN